MARKPTAARAERKKLPLPTKLILLTEAGYRCAVPTCRQILALDLHHIWHVSDSGSDDPANLIALCPTDHALHHRGIIPRDSLFAWKAMLVALTGAFDIEAVDKLLFLEGCDAQGANFLVLSGDGVLEFARLVAGGLVSVRLQANNNGQLVTYNVTLTPRGKQLVSAWKLGDRTKLQKVIRHPTNAAAEISV